MMGRIFINVNGEKRQIEDNDSISYSHLCSMADYDPSRMVTVIYSMPSGREGRIHPDSRGPLIDGAKYHLSITNNA